VVGKDVARNVLFVDQGSDSPYLLSNDLTSEAAHWISGDPPARHFTCAAQTRYRQQEEPCAVSVRDDGSLQVRFERPQRAVTPGQSLVLYAGEACLGGAVIATTDAPLELHPHTIEHHGCAA
jgi:tRNA-specific 2-thiouridylase